MSGEEKAPAAREPLTFAEAPHIAPAELASLCEGIGLERAAQILRGARMTEEERKEVSRALLAWRDAHEIDETEWELVPR